MLTPTSEGHYFRMVYTFLYTNLLFCWKKNYLCSKLIIFDMEVLSVRDYRNNLAASFDRAEQGEQVLIRRRNRIYSLISLGREDLTITPALQERINEARKAYKDGNVISCATSDELSAFLDSL